MAYADNSALKLRDLGTQFGKLAKSLSPASLASFCNRRRVFFENCLHMCVASQHSAQSATNVRSDLLREIQEAIATFEPRLTKVHVSLISEGRGGPIRFNIEAELRTDPTPEAVRFETTLDVASKAVVVSEGADA